MLKSHVVISCLFVASFLLMASPAHPHGDHKDKPAPAEQAPTDNIYSAENETPTSPDMDLPLSRMDIVMDEPSHKDHKDMEKGHDEHAGHKMPDVKISTHEWVSTSQKGYGAAVGITILAGLVFGALSFMRPNE